MTGLHCMLKKSFKTVEMKTVSLSDWLLYICTPSIQNCEGCLHPIKSDGPAVIAERVGPNKCWHPHCFVCSECKELLVELIYFGHKGQLFCGRHHSEKLKPRCAACDEVACMFVFIQNYPSAFPQPILSFPF